MPSPREPSTQRSSYGEYHVPPVMVQRLLRAGSMTASFIRASLPVEQPSRGSSVTVSAARASRTGMVISSPGGGGGGQQDSDGGQGGDADAHSPLQKVTKRW